MKKDILQELKENPFVLAPMAGITDHAFRSFMREMGAGIVITELISATGLEYNSSKTLSLMSFGQDQHPVGIQLFGGDPEIMSKAAQLAESKGCDFVDINLGCPVPKVVKKGAGSALLKDLPQLKNLLRSVKSSISIPLTIKIRTGWDDNSKNATEVVQLAYDEGVTWVSIHGRTRAQGYSGKADWDLISEVKSKSPLPIIGNGDLNTPQIAIERLKSSGCDGVMIGRGCLKNPFLFSQCQELLKTQTQSSEGHAFDAYMKLYKHLSLYCTPNILLLQLKKFAAWYSSGYSGASQFRKQVFQTHSVEEILEKAETFFKTVSYQEDTSQEDFLMGGHG